MFRPYLKTQTKLPSQFSSEVRARHRFRQGLVKIRNFFAKLEWKQTFSWDDIFYNLIWNLEIIRFVTDSVVSSSPWLFWTYSMIIPNRIEVDFSIASVIWFLLDRFCIKVSIENQQDNFFIPSIEGQKDAVWDICHLTMTILIIKKDICQAWWTIQSDPVQIFYTHLRILSLLMYVSYPTDLIYDWLFVNWSSSMCLPSYISGVFLAFLWCILATV